MQNGFKHFLLLICILIVSTYQTCFAKNFSDFYQNEIEIEPISIEITIDRLHRLYQCLVDKEYEVPPLDELFKEMVDYAHFCGVPLKDEWIEDLKQLLALPIAEEAWIQPSFFKNGVNIEIVPIKRKKEMAVPDHVAIGFCKALAGALLCIIPNPASQGLGAILIGAGVQEMLQKPHTHTSDRHPPNHLRKSLLCFKPDTLIKTMQN